MGVGDLARRAGVSPVPRFPGRTGARLGGALQVRFLLPGPCLAGRGAFAAGASQSEGPGRSAVRWTN